MVYRVLPGYLDLWRHTADVLSKHCGKPEYSEWVEKDELIVNDGDIRRLARDWADYDVQEMENQLYKQVVEVEEAAM